MLELDTLAGLLSGRAAAPSLVPRRCPPASTGRDICRDCLRSCPRGAVSFERGPVFGETCDGCGACVKACPQEALRAPASWPAPARGAAGQSRAGQAVRFRCPWGSAAEDASHVVQCLAMVDLADLLECFASGAAAVELDASACARCERRQGLEPVKEAVATARQMLGESGRIDWAPAAGVASPAKTEAPSLSRRGLLELFGLRARRRLARWIPSAAGEDLPGVAAPAAAAASGTSSGAAAASLDAGWHALPTRRVRLLEALARLGAAAGPPSGARPFAALKVDRRCDACSVCSSLCPAGALRQVSTPGSASLWFRPRACTGCGLCLDVCATGAVSMGPAASLEPALRDFLEKLVEVPWSACVACGRGFRPPERESTCCPSCAWRPASRRTSTCEEHLSR